MNRSAVVFYYEEGQLRHYLILKTSWLRLFIWYRLWIACGERNDQRKHGKFQIYRLDLALQLRAQNRHGLVPLPHRWTPRSVISGFLRSHSIHHSPPSTIEDPPASFEFRKKMFLFFSSNWWSIRKFIYLLIYPHRVRQLRKKNDG